ncbi:MAG: transporter substrate-binding domain-containing protein [Azospirillaceae bacterium]|nr:transporter substrate-binding domain-containing protein [Azospirillaceae bacterium]
MKKWIVAAVAGLGMLTAANVQAKPVRIGTEAAYAPFEFKDASGELKGLEIELGNAMCKSAKIECVWVNMDFDSLIAALNAKKIDAVFSQMSITDERKQSVAFTDMITKAPAQLIAKVGSGLTDDPATLKGKTIGVQSGTTHERYANEKLKSVATIKVYQSQDEAYLELQSGRIDATLCDQTLGFDWLSKEGKKDGFDFAGKVIDDPAIFGEGTGIAVRKDDAALRGQFNKALAAVLKDGTFKKINDAYFPFSLR